MIERRKHERLELEDLPARMFKQPDKRELDFTPINVSREGISIYSSEQLIEGDRVFLELDEKNVELEVRWCRANPDNIAIFRSGLVTIEKEIRLDVLVKKQLEVDI